MTTEKLYHQDGDEKREYTEAEYAQHAKDAADAAAAKVIEDELKAKEAADKAALLAKLGITADEAKLLLS
jgi:predicted metalloprotease with PDZ domain